jgi:hypothetical protein
MRRSSALSRRWRGKTKPLSALIRVRDGEEFLSPSVESIINLVDEVVIVNNRSQDGTGQIIKALAAGHPGKIRDFFYEHDVTPVGEDSYQLNRRDPLSMRLPHNFSNWCMSQCRHPFVLKWDDDMLATPSMERHVRAFQKSPYLLSRFGGHNISPDFKHVLAWRCGIEPLLLPASTPFCIHDFGRVVKSGTLGKYAGEGPTPWVTELFQERIETPIYVHLKYCKKNPGKNQSPSFRSELEQDMAVEGPIPEEFAQTMSRFGIQVR